MGLIPDADLDLLAAYAIDAVDPADELLVEAQLAGSADATDVELDLRAAGTAYADAALGAATLAAPPPSLRSSVLAAARAARPGRPVVASTAAETFLTEAHHLIGTLRSLPAEAWDRAVDPPELEGWTIADVVAHIASNQALAADQLGVGDPSIPEHDLSNEGRTAEVQVRHRRGSRTESLDELEGLTERIEDRVAGHADADLGDDLLYLGIPMRGSSLLLHRAFEMWIHHADICRAAGRPVPVTSSASLAAMSRQAAEWTPLFLSTAEATLEGGVATLDLTGDGGIAHAVPLGFAEPAPDTEPRFVLEIDVREFCLAIGARSPAAGPRYRATGDTELAATLVRALPALAAV